MLEAQVLERIAHRARARRRLARLRLGESHLRTLPLEAPFATDETARCPLRVCLALGYGRQRARVRLLERGRRLSSGGYLCFPGGSLRGLGRRLCHQRLIPRCSGLVPRSLSVSLGGLARLSRLGCGGDAG